MKRWLITNCLLINFIIIIVLLKIVRWDFFCQISFILSWILFISFVFRRTGNVFDLPLQFFGKYTELRYDWDKRGKDAPRILKAELAEKQMEDEWLDLQSEFKSSEEYWKVESWMWWQYDSQLGLERAATAALGKLIWYAKLKENWEGCEGSWNHKGV